MLHGVHTHSAPHLSPRWAPHSVQLSCTTQIALKLLGQVSWRPHYQNLGIAKSLVFPFACLVTGAGASNILCDSIDIEVLEKGSVIFANPLAAGDAVECTGTYTLSPDDVENLRRESVVTVEAKDEDGYRVGKSVTETVPLNQASEKYSVDQSPCSRHWACMYACFPFFFRV